MQVTSSFKKKTPLYIEKRFMYHCKTRAKISFWNEIVKTSSA